MKCLAHFMAFIPAILCMILIFMFSAAPAENSSEMSDGLSYKIVDAVGQLPFFHWDDTEKATKAEMIHIPLRKTAHFSEYAILAVLWAAPLGLFLKKTWKRLGLAFIICVLYACTDELHQLFVPGRDGNIRDVLIDGAGAAVGILLWSIVYGRRAMRTGKRKSTT